VGRLGRLGFLSGFFLFCRARPVCESNDLAAHRIDIHFVDPTFPAVLMSYEDINSPFSISSSTPSILPLGTRL
jgi:hypothetical protein